MPDISMCLGPVDCKVKSNCYRKTAIPSSFWQSYADFKPNGVACDHYWPNNPNVHKVVLHEGVYKRIIKPLKQTGETNVL